MDFKPQVNEVCGGKKTMKSELVGIPTSGKDTDSIMSCNMNEGRCLVLRRLKNMNKKKSDKQLVLSLFENAYKSWAYGNYYSLSKETVDSFKAWSSFNEESRKGIKEIFLKGKV